MGTLTLHTSDGHHLAADVADGRAGSARRGGRLPSAPAVRRQPVQQRGRGAVRRAPGGRVHHDPLRLPCRARPRRRRAARRGRGDRRWSRTALRSCSPATRSARSWRSRRATTGSARSSPSRPPLSADTEPPAVPVARAVAVARPVLPGRRRGGHRRRVARRHRRGDPVRRPLPRRSHDPRRRAHRRLAHHPLPARSAAAWPSLTAVMHRVVRSRSSASSPR